MTLEKMVLTKKVSRKQARKEKLAAMNSKMLMSAQRKGRSRSLLAVDKKQRSSKVMCRSQPKVGGSYLMRHGRSLLPFNNANSLRK